MKKPKRGCLIFAAGVCAVFAAACFVLSSSALQTKIANSEIQKRFPNGSVKKVSISPFGAEIESLELEFEGGKTFAAQKLSAKYFLPALVFGELEISELSLAGAEYRKTAAAPLPSKAVSQNLQASARKSSTPAKAESAAATPEIKTADEEAAKPFELPNISIKIAKASADFTAELDGGNKIFCGLLLQNLETKKTALPLSFDLKISARAGAKGAEGKAPQIDAAASMRKSEIKLSAKKGGKKILQLLAKIDPDYSKFESRAQIDVSSADVSDFIGGVPEFSVVSMSDLNFDSKLKNASLKISANAEASELSRISKNLSSVKSARLSAEISASKTGGNFTLANAEVSVSANGESVLRLKNSNSFSFSKSGIANLADGRLVEIETANIPPEIVEAFLGGISLSFQSLPAKFALAKLGEKFELQTEKPLALKNFTLIKDGKTLASGVSPSISLEGATDLKTANASLLLELKRGEPESFKASLSAALNADKSADFKILANGPLESLAQGFSPDARAPKCAVNSEISASLKNNVLAVKSAGLKLLDGGKAIADFYAQKEILLDAKSGKILSYPVRIEMSADDAPFAAFAPFAGGIGADRFSLRLNLDAESGDAASLLGLIKISNGSYAPEGRAMFENLDASANVDFRLNKKNLSAKIAGLKVSQGAGDIFSADAELAAGLNFEDPKISKIEKFKLSAGASLPPVLAQPALKKFDNAHFGTAKISAEFGGENEAVADIRIDNLKPRTMRESVDVVLAKIKARFGSGEIGLPQSAELSFESESPRGKTSALASAREKGGEVFINIAADAVCADDILILKTAFENKIASQYPAANYSASGAKIRIARPKEALAASAAKSTEPPPESAKSATPPAKAPWDFGKTANMNAAVKSAVYEGREYLKNLSAEAKIEPKKIELKKCSAEMFERPASAEFSLSFSGADGYLLESSSLKISDFKIENLLSPNGAGEYFLEGDYTLSASAKGAGRGAEELLKNADANFELSSKNGKLRLIDKSTNVGRISSVGSALLKISAAFLNEKVNELGAVAQLADMLQTLQISDLKISAAKKGDSIEFADARIFAPPILLKMGGKIEGFDPTRASEARISAPVEMYAQNGEIGDLLKKIGFGQAAGGQYVAGPKFEIYGSLLEPKNNLLEVLSDSFKNFSIKLRRE